MVASLSTAILLAHRLPDRLRHGAAAAALAAACDDAGHRAVLDLVPYPHLCVDEHPAARRHAEQGADASAASSTSRWRGSRPIPRCISASSTPTFRSWCCRSMRRWRRSTVVAGGRCRPRLLAHEGVLAGDAPAAAAGNRRRAAALLHSYHRRIRNPDLLAGSDPSMIGQTLWPEFFTNKDWPAASALGCGAAVRAAGAAADLRESATQAS